MTTERERFAAFRDGVDRARVIDVDELIAMPDGWLKRACVVYLARGDREVATDAQLEQLARGFGGKIATFIDGILIARRVKRGDADARRAADAYGQAWLKQRLQRVE